MFGIGLGVKASTGGGNNFMAVTEDGQINKSEDGVTFLDTGLDTGAASSCSMAWNNDTGEFMYIDDSNGYVRRVNRDGTTLTNFATPGTISIGRGIAYKSSNKRLMILCRRSSDNALVVHYADNFGSWTEVALSGSGVPLSLIYDSAANRWTALDAAGNIHYSTDDGATWSSAITAAGMNNPASPLAFKATNEIAAGRSSSAALYKHSTNGTSYTDKTASDGVNNLGGDIRGIAYDSVIGKWLFAAAAVVTRAFGFVTNPANDTTFTLVDHPDGSGTPQIRGAVGGFGKLIAYGRNGAGSAAQILYSSNGSSLTAASHQFSGATMVRAVGVAA